MYSYGFKKIDEGKKCFIDMARLLGAGGKKIVPLAYDIMISWSLQSKRRLGGVFYSALCEKEVYSTPYIHQKKTTRLRQQE